MGVRVRERVFACLRACVSGCAMCACGCGCVSVSAAGRVRDNHGDS